MRTRGPVLCELVVGDSSFLALSMPVDFGLGLPAPIYPSRVTYFVSVYG